MGCVVVGTTILSAFVPVMLAFVAYEPVQADL